MTTPDPQKTTNFVGRFWDDHIVPTLVEYIKIPNKSPHFDPDWEKNGHMERVLQLALAWIEKHKPSGTQVHIGRLPGRTPLILLDIPGTGDDTVLLYGHLDKQPEMTGWREGLGPWQPVLENDMLYGRGGADDGYALFASLCAIKAMQDQGKPHARAVVMIEFSEESGSSDLAAYVDHFSERIGQVSLVVCLDSGAGNYEQLWSTTSLRGLIGGNLRVDVLTEGVHSGDASGVISSSFRILRQLVSRIEDLESGEIKAPELKVEIPSQRLDQARKVAETLGEEVYSKFPLMPGMVPMNPDPTQLILNRTWRAALSFTGQDGMPPTVSGGNVLRPYTTLKLSLRIPPTLSAKRAQAFLVKTMTENPPYGAKITASFDDAASGWNAPALASWLDKALDEASNAYYGKPTMHMGEGGSIPFMGMLGDKFPEAQFVVTGVLGPHSNAHGPNEFLHIPYAKKVTCCVVHILARHFGR